MDRIVVARWVQWDGTGLQHLVLHEGPDQIVADAAVVGTDEGRDFAARFRIVCDPRWTVRTLTVEVIGDPRRVSLSSDGAGRWTDGAGARRSELDGAIDVDLPITPFTNTLPVRRLGLKAGDSAEIMAVYVRLVPKLSVTTDPQRYACLELMRRYRYESVDSDFTREIEVDEHGLVVTYPGLFRRVA